MGDCFLLFEGRQRVLDGAVLEIGAALLVEAAFGAIFPVFFVANKEAFDFEVRGRASPMMVNDVLSASGERWSHYHYSWIPPSRLSRLESFWLHPMPLRIHVNETHADPEQWTALDVFFCGKRYESPALLKEEHARGSVAVCAFRNETGDLPWEVPSREDAAQAERRVATDRGVTWGDWTFTALLSAALAFRTRLWSLFSNIYIHRRCFFVCVDGKRRLFYKKRVVLFQQSVVL